MVDLQAPSDAVSSARQGTEARPGLGQRMRGALAAGVSSIVLLASVAYVFAPANASVQLSVTEVTGAPAYQRDISPEYTLASAQSSARRKVREVIYGTIDTRGVPVSQAVLVIEGAGERTRGHGATIRIGDAVTFRSVVQLRPGNYTLTFRMKVGDKDKTVSTTRRINNRKSYEINVKVRDSGIVTFLPVTSY
jgi:hypothetical protein